MVHAIRMIKQMLHILKRIQKFVENRNQLIQYIPVPVLELIVLIHTYVYFTTKVDMTENINTA